MLAASQMLQYAVVAVLNSEAALSKTAVVAGLASALTSLVKRAAQFTKTAELQRMSTVVASAAPEAVAGGCATEAASANFAAAHLVMNDSVLRAANAVKAAAAVCVSSSSSSQQVPASLAFLAAMLAHSLVQLADAMEAAVPQLLFDSLTAGITVKVAWSRSGRDTRYWVTSFKPLGSEEQHNVAGHWCQWQLMVLQTFKRLLDALRILGVAPAAAAQEPAAEAPAGAAEMTSAAQATLPGVSSNQDGGIPSSSSSSSRMAAAAVRRTAALPPCAPRLLARPTRRAGARLIPPGRPRAAALQQPDWQTQRCPCHKLHSPCSAGLQLGVVVMRASKPQEQPRSLILMPLHRRPICCRSSTNTSTTIRSTIRRRPH
jgi:hypothetical protein